MLPGLNIRKEYPHTSSFYPSPPTSCQLLVDIDPLENLQALLWNPSTKSYKPIFVQVEPKFFLFQDEKQQQQQIDPTQVCGISSANLRSIEEKLFPTSGHRQQQSLGLSRFGYHKRHVPENTYIAAPPHTMPSLYPNPPSSTTGIGATIAELWRHAFKKFYQNLSEKVKVKSLSPADKSWIERILSETQNAFRNEEILKESGGVIEFTYPQSVSPNAKQVLSDMGVDVMFNPKKFSYEITPIRPGTGYD